MTEAIFTHAILFSGHMIDAIGRKEPRFPAEKEAAVREAVNETLKKIHAAAKAKCVGIAGAASGGDILFHECCRNNGIASEIYLVLPALEFENQSVAPAGKIWVYRFHSLLQQVPVHLYTISGDKDELLKTGEVWELANNWMLENAFQSGSMGCSLITVWDERAGDGPGGTKHMVDEMRRLGHDVHIINPLFL